MRLDYYLSVVLKKDKKSIKEILKNKKIRVNEFEVINGKFNFDLNKDIVYFDNQALTKNPFTYIMFHKPKGYLSANKDNYQPTIMDLLPKQYHNLNIVGRLDRDTTGLIILTDDHVAFKQLTLPKQNHEKEYVVTLKYPVKPNLINLFRQGIVIDNNYKLLPAQLEIINKHQVRVVIVEGRYHQIKKMFLSVGNEVVDLHRIRINQLVLANSLKLGEYKKLDNNQIKKLLVNLDLEKKR